MNLPSFLLLLDRVNDLKLLPRTGWLFKGIRQPESVADHTCAVALLATLLAEMVNADVAGQGLQTPLDVGRVARIALVHDLAESVLTDLSHRSTALLGETIKHQAEEKAIRQIFADLPMSGDSLHLWKEYNTSASPEARLVRDADKLEMAHQSLRYEQAGHRNLAEFRKAHDWAFPISAQIYEMLCEARY